MRTLNRRAFLSGITAALLAGSGVRARAEYVTRPNVVFIMADDLGYGDLGCYGGKTPTPQIDALAAGGVRFTDYHSNGAVCTPTRAALMTGRYQQRCGINQVFRAEGRGDGEGLPHTTPMLPEVLRASGYATALFGKWHLGYAAAFNPTKYGFDTFRGFVSGNIDYQSHVDGAGAADWWNGDQLESEPGYLTDLIAKHSVEFIRANAARPFFLSVMHGAVHTPFQGRTDKSFREADKPSPGAGPRSDKAAAYAEMLTALDDSVGAIVGALRDANVLENTLVVFCSDNGATGVGSNGVLSGKKGGVLEGGHRVPAIAYWPGRIEPGVRDGLAMTMDWYPTIASLCKTPVPEGLALDGVTIERHLFNAEPTPVRTVFWRTKANNGERAARRGVWKLVLREEGEALYNVVDDIRETKNVIGEQVGIAGELSAALKAWEASFAEVRVIS